jgi:ubiquitin carboxyl-terminal hydrolase 34
MDVRTLSRHASKPPGEDFPDLPSRSYLHTLAFLFRKEEGGHIGKNLETHYGWNWDAELPIFTTCFQSGGGTLSNLTKLVEEQIKLVPRFPRIIDSFSEPCRLIYRALQDATNAGRHTSDASRQELVRGHGFFRAMSACMVSIIEERASFLTPDSAQTIVNALTNILYATLIYENSATRELVADKCDEHTGLSLKLVAKIISLERKFTILKKFITSAQMQLRVVGVTTMCGDLLHLHSLYKGNDASQNPVLLYFADFMIQNKIMEYLVGVASHPEIINESYNILGFLIVTNTCTTSLVSTIWQTMSNSQDLRVAEAILRMLQRCFNLQRYEDLIYLCEKATSLPIENFTVTMRDYCDELLRVLIDKVSIDGSLQIDAPPYYLCMWLLRESAVMGKDLPTGYPDIQTFAFARFCDLCKRGPSDDIREQIYAECVLDISSKAASAAGSICVINGLLQSQLELDLRKLTVEHSLTRLVIEELECAIAEDRFTGTPSTTRPAPVTAARQDLLLTIILKEPGMITTELGTKLWNILVGSESKRIADRITSWKILNGAVRRSSIDNTFLADCLKVHLPSLPPDCFTEGTLEFARAALSAWLDDAREDIVHGEREFESPALEQLWRMILMSPPNTIEGRATLALVHVYVERILLMALPRAKSRNIHLALVDRCLRQLASAADKLKMFDEQKAPSGEDTSMTEAATEIELQDQELIFARSLAVLRDFLRAYQSKPQFATPKPKASQLGLSHEVEGEPMTVKYQSFDGEKHTEVMTLTLGKLNTAASLVSSLQKATGFKNFRLYYGGKSFDPDEIEVTRSLEDLNLNGLVLVQKRNEDVSVMGSKNTLELEITTRMDELWGYLGMRDKVAQEVRLDSFIL